MGVIGFTKTFRIEYDPVKGEIDFENEGEMTYTEVLAALEYVKMMIFKEMLREIGE